jgi:cell division protein FtsL
MQAYVTEHNNIQHQYGFKSTITQNPSLSKAYFSIALSTSEKLIYLFSVIVICILLGLIINRSATLFELNAQMGQMESEIRQLEETNLLLANEIAKMESPQRLIEKGIQLGLSMPEQIQNVQSKDLTNHTVAIVTTN